MFWRCLSGVGLSGVCMGSGVSWVDGAPGVLCLYQG